VEGIQSDFSRKTRTKSRFVSCIADSVVIVMLSLWHADPSWPSYVFLSKRSGLVVLECILFEVLVPHTGPKAQKRDEGH